NLAHETMRVRIAADVPAGGKQSVERAGHETAVRHRDDRELRADRRADADFVRRRRAAAPVLALDPGKARQPPRVAHAELAGALQRVGALESWRMTAEELA